MENQDHSHARDGAHDHSHGHTHGHENDRGIQGMLRYAKHARALWRSDVNEAVVARLAPKSGETVVDIGAGVGAGTMVAAKTGATVVALEPTPYMRQILDKRRLFQSARDRIRVLDGAAEASGLDDASVDAAWAVNTMHHWTDPTKASVELARILRPGGRLLLADEDFDDPTHPDHDLFTERHSGDHGFHMVDLDVMADLLRKAGFEVQLSEKQQLAKSPSLVVEATKMA